MSPPPHEMTRSESARTTSVAVMVTTVDVLTAASKLKEDDMIMYLDVRTEEEMAKGHLPGSLNIPYMFITPQGKSLPHRLGPGRRTIYRFVEQVASLFTKDQHLLVGCQSGKRSELACIDLLAAGFMNVKNVGGGYAAWVDNGLPIAVAATVHTPPDSVAAT